MPDTIRCPDCGHENPAGSASCSRCNFPLQEAPAAPPPAPAPEGEPGIVIPRPVRRVRPRPAASQAATLWLVLGLVAAALLVWQGLEGFHKSNAPPVEGANADQARLADSLRQVLGRDSTDVEANIEYANLLYDTANWSDAARHYARALARDSSHVTAIVDMGVCYYNQGEFPHAEQIFLLALTHEPGQPVALFNLGIVNERRGDTDAALKFFHRALEANTPEGMKQQIMQHMQALLQKSGRKAPPLEPGAVPPGMPPGAMPPAGSGR